MPLNSTNVSERRSKITGETCVLTGHVQRETSIGCVHFGYVRQIDGEAGGEDGPYEVYPCPNPPMPHKSAMAGGRRRVQPTGQDFGGSQPHEYTYRYERMRFS